MLTPTGQDDTKAIRTAAESGSVVLADGDYTITQPLQLPDGIGLDGTEYTIQYRGEATKRPAVSVTNAFVRGLRLRCNGLSDGLQTALRRYELALFDVQVHDALGRGIDAIDCWGSLFQVVWVNNCQGTAIRMSRCNSTLWQQCRMLGHTGMILSINQSNMVAMDGLCMEKCKDIEHAMEVRESWLVAMRDVRFEKCAFTQQSSLIHNEQGSDWRYGRFVSLDGLQFSSGQTVSSIASGSAVVDVSRDVISGKVQTA